MAKDKFVMWPDWYSAKYVWEYEKQLNDKEQTLETTGTTQLLQGQKGEQLSVLFWSLSDVFVLNSVLCHVLSFGVSMQGTAVRTKM